jgi:uncharacterized membrane protein
MTVKILNYVGWSIVLSASLYFIFNNAFHYFSFNKHEYGASLWPQHAPWLLIHIICGMTALILGPFQFIPAIRKKYPKVHRTMGKVYLCNVLVAGIASLDLSINKIIITEKAIAYGTGLAMLAIVWLLTSGMAYWSVRSKNFLQHREWMVRSFVVTCAFTTFRLMAKILAYQFHLGPSDLGPLLAWFCWAIPLFITEIFLQGNKIRKGNLVPANNKSHVLS